MTLYGHRVPMWVALILWFIVWEIIGLSDSVMLIPPLTSIFASFVEVTTTRSFKEAVSVSLQAFGMGMGLSLTVGLTVGFLMARYKTAGEIGGMWINIFESSPISAVVPLLLAVIGFGMQTMVVTVFLFSVWVIALDTQVGVQHANKSLIEMARSFGASRRDL
jgi:NitT/TauT family transport system permease protein